MQQRVTAVVAMLFNWPMVLLGAEGNNERQHQIKEREIKMKDTRKFYRTVIQVEVLSEEPISDTADLTAISYELEQGDYLGTILSAKQTIVSGKRMATLLQSQGNDPGFFQLLAGDVKKVRP